MKRFYLWSSVALMFSLASAVSYADFPKPAGPVILSVSGAIDQLNHNKPIQFDRAMLESLPSYQITTTNPWEEGLHTYRGFHPQDLLKQLDSDGDLLRISALNHYITEIPLSDFELYDALIAYEMDYKNMSVRQKGPLMVIYNFDAHTKLRSETYYGRSIWQIHAIEVLHSGG